MADKKVYTEEQKKEALELEATIGNRAAAEKTGISWQQIARWKKEASSTEAKPAAAKKPAKTKAAPKATKKAKTVKEAAVAAPAPKKKAVKAKEAENKASTSAAKKASKAKSEKLTIIVQNPYGGNISTSEIAEKLPADCDTVFIRVDQNKLWWIKKDETGSVDIW